MNRRNRIAHTLAVVLVIVIVAVAWFVYHQVHTPAPQLGKVITPAPAPQPEITPENENLAKAQAIQPGPGRYYHSGSTLMPNPEITPGLTRPDATEESVCNGGSTKQFRNTTETMKQQVYAAYAVKPHTGVCEDTTRTTKDGKQVTESCEIDHVVSLELGGADDKRNLFPQPYNPAVGLGAHDKDKVENFLHRAVCSGHSMSLKDAQHAIATDWVQVYRDNQLGDSR